MFYQAHGSVTERESEERPFERAELQMAGHHLYRLRVDGQDAAIASMFVHGGVASSLSATVLPAFRRRGLQRLLIEWRCAHARELGCELLTASASRFGESHRNLERCGFGYWCFGSQWSEEAD
jgi:GNAT superfamily N-acetyltransferase